MEDQLQRLNQARKVTENFSKEKSRMAGELDSQRKRLSEEEEKCQTEFNCKIDELPSIIEQLQVESETALSNAEIILGLKEGEVQQEVPVEEPVEEVPPAIVQKAAPAGRKGKVVQRDEDGLI